MDPLLRELNEKQRQAVLSPEGPLLILAGPGSGKTKTITHRIAYLIRQGAHPEEILAVTFTNKAAGEMAERIRELLSPRLSSSVLPPSLPFIGTFHAFAARILRAHAEKIGFLPGFTIYDKDDALGLIKEVMKELSINPKQFAPGMIAAVVSGLKNELLTPERYGEEQDISELFPRTVFSVYEAYQKRLFESNAMDFDDLLMHLCALFEKRPDVLSSYQQRFRYLNVDEYQDVNHAQYVMARALAKSSRNIAVVGDDAQAIYGFRGADIRNILNFEKDWPDAKVIILDQNYRSTKTILDAADTLIAKNPLQKKKRLWTARKEGERIILAALGDERGEAEFVAVKTKEILQSGQKAENIAVLYRTNAQSRVLEEKFLEEDIPYRLVGGVRFYQRKEVKDIVAYLRAAANPRDFASIKRIINVPARGIGKKTLLGYLASASGAEADALQSENNPALARFAALLADLRKKMTSDPPAFFFQNLLKKIGYREYLNDRFANSDERWENVEELINLARSYDDFPPPEGSLKLLEDVALLSESEESLRGKEPPEAVSLMTVHAAKGLEFAAVFIVGMEEGIFPHGRSLFNPAELEEERRLCYVGITRAKEKLYLSFAARRASFGSIQANPPSRFLSEIPPDLIEIDQEPALETIEL
jgi:DNA helicase-2/ATP-dependent DNA helicase PcrA